MGVALSRAVAFSTLTTYCMANCWKFGETRWAKFLLDTIQYQHAKSARGSDKFKMQLERYDEARVRHASLAIREPNRVGGKMRVGRRWTIPIYEYVLLRNVNVYLNVSTSTRMSKAPCAAAAAAVAVAPL